MRSGAVLTAIAFAVLAGTSSSAAQSPALPGTIVDVKATEFAFLAPDSIPAGLTTFRLLQTGMVEAKRRAGVRGPGVVTDKDDATYGFHMLWIVRLDEGKTYGDLLHAAQQQTPRPWARNLGGPGFTFPPRTTNATLLLEPGNYALVCEVGGARADRTRSHLLKGMIRPLKVGPRVRSAAALPPPDIIARLRPDTVELSAVPRSGRQIVRVVNETQRNSEFGFGRVLRSTPGASRRELRQRGDLIPWSGLSVVPAGGTVTTTIDLEPAQYFVGVSGKPDVLLITVR